VGASLLAIAPAQPPSMSKMHHNPTHPFKSKNTSEPARENASPANINAESATTLASHPHPAGLKCLFFDFFYEPSTNSYLSYLHFRRLFLHGLWDLS
jgi:hypothetical protein